MKKIGRAARPFTRKASGYAKKALHNYIDRAGQAAVQKSAGM